MPGGNLRFSDAHLAYLVGRARLDPQLSGELLLKENELPLIWQNRLVIRYPNFLFFFESYTCSKALVMIFLEYSTVVVLSLTKLKDMSNQVRQFIYIHVHTHTLSLAWPVPFIYWQF